MPPVHEESQPRFRRHRLLWLVGVGALLILGIPKFEEFLLTLRQAKERNNLVVLGFGIQVYASDYDEHLPIAFHTPRTLRQSLGKYVTQEGVFQACNPAGGQYIGNARFEGWIASSFPETQQVPVVYNPQPWSNGTICFRPWDVDDDIGRAVPEKKFQMLLAAPIPDGAETPKKAPDSNGVPKL